MPLPLGMLSAQAHTLAAAAPESTGKIHPRLALDAGLGLRPQEAESVLVGLLLLVGANLAWLGLTEAAEAAGA